MKWYQKPIAALGALSLAYHEVMRGRRVSVCTECGRLNHATADRCLCGAVSEEHDHADPAEYPAAEYDSFDRFPYTVIASILPFAAGFVVAWLLYISVSQGSYLAAFAALGLGLVFG